MRVEVRDRARRRRGRIEVDPAARPTRVHLDRDESTEDGAPADLFLQWDEVLDDAGHLRRCLICGCTHLFASRALPALTPFIVIGAFAGAAVGILGYATDLRVLAGLVVLLVLDVAILVIARRRLVCYRCRSVFIDAPVARWHRPFERDLAEREECRPEPIPEPSPDPIPDRASASSRGEEIAG